MPIRNIKKVKIGGRDFRVLYKPIVVDGTQTLAGKISYSAGEIEIDEGGHPTFQAETLLHEIVHGILSHGGEREHDERLVDLISNGLLQVLRDNPRLVEEILSEFSR